MAQTTTSLTLPLLPLPDGVLVPGMVVTIAVTSDEAARALEAARVSGDDRLLVVPRIDGTIGSLGTVVAIEQSDRLAGGRRGVLVRGLARARVLRGTTGSGDANWVEVETIDDEVSDVERADQLATAYRALVEAILARRGADSRLAATIIEIDHPGQLADTAVYSPDLDLGQKVEVLETVDVVERLEKVVGWAREVLTELDVRKRIADEVTESLENRQREMILRQQLEAIRKELRDLNGDGEQGVYPEDYRARVADADLPAHVLKAVSKEVERLERTSDSSPESSWIRTWLDRILEIPWAERSEDRLDLDQARAILDADHTGLNEVKERIVEQLAVRKLKAERGDSSERPGAPARRDGGAVLALVGPPGVGKTSLGESVARALGRRFVRVALGGVRDEAEIRGHRRTYVGAQPGRVARAITEAGTMNPVMLLDEIDKVGGDWRGDPSAALLEVLDPAQNHTFRDHYLEVDLDLSDVLFLATANVLETIPAPLLDRLEVVRLDGYTDDEKVTIARDHLLGRQLTRAGLTVDEVEISDEVLRQVVEGWTREAGVRQLERQLATIARKAATQIAGGAGTPVVVDDPAGPLGRRKIFNETADRTAVPGVATGLAVTGTGGDVLFIEATSAPADRPALQLTGQLGDVMKESASIALSYLRSHEEQTGIDTAALSDRLVHVHVPAGAVPKDGPSAGIALTTALASLVSGRTVRANVGMTGEVTLQGRVLPVGGIKQKVLAAHRAGLGVVLLPERNGPDLDDVPQHVREDLTIHLVSDVTEVLAHALD